MNHNAISDSLADVCQSWHESALATLMNVLQPCFHAALARAYILEQIGVYLQQVSLQCHPDSDFPILYLCVVSVWAYWPDNNPFALSQHKEAKQEIRRSLGAAGIDITSWFEQTLDPQCYLDRQRGIEHPIAGRWIAGRQFRSRDDLHCTR
jgi:hypothetical protein